MATRKKGKMTAAPGINSNDDTEMKGTSDERAIGEPDDYYESPGEAE
jgi:hypothetical protein